MMKKQYLVTNPELYLGQSYFDSRYEKYTGFLILSKDYKIQVFCTYLPNINDLITRGELIAPIKDDLKNPQIEDFSVVNHIVIYTQDAHLYKSKKEKPTDEREMVYRTAKNDRKNLVNDMKIVISQSNEVFMEREKWRTLATEQSKTLNFLKVNNMIKKPRSKFSQWLLAVIIKFLQR